MKTILLSIFAFSLSATAATKQDVIHYFSCNVTEGKAEVSVKFAIKNFNPNKAEGELESYPGADEDQGFSLVTPSEKNNGSWTRMSNLNGQGGDLRVKSNGDVELYGDGDGIQSTYLRLWWDADDLDEVTSMEGYVRDITDGDKEWFKQFIKCDVSTTVL